MEPLTTGEDTTDEIPWRSGMRQALWNPFPILDQNVQLSPPYFTPNPKSDTLYQN